MMEIIALNRCVVNLNKRDFTYIKHIKHEIKQKERSDQYLHNCREYQRMESIAQSVSADRELHHANVCKEAAKMSNYERLVNYAGTLDATYLGTNCNWDILTRLGLKKR